jgi:hypothetical protein
MRKVNQVYTILTCLFHFYLDITLPPTPRSSASLTANIDRAHFIILDLITLKLYIGKENPRFTSSDRDNKFILDGLPRMMKEHSPFS